MPLLNVPSIRKPDVFVIDSAVRRNILLQDLSAYRGADLLMAVEVVSLRSGNEQTDRVKKRIDYAEAGIPIYWIVDFKPEARIEILELTERGTYKTVRVAAEDDELKVGKPFPISLVPATLLNF